MTKQTEVIPFQLPILKQSTSYQLPAKLSVFLRESLDDLRKCEADPRYKIAMEDWHVPASSCPNTKEPVCYVCLGGAVMAQRLGASPDEVIMPSRFPKIYGALLAADSARCGRIAEAWKLFYGTEEWAPDAVMDLGFSWRFLSNLPCRYPEEGWWEAMEDTITGLETLGY